MPIFLFLLHFNVICDQLLNRRTETWNLYVKLTQLSFTDDDVVYLKAVLRLHDEKFTPDLGNLLSHRSKSLAGRLEGEMMRLYNRVPEVRDVNVVAFRCVLSLVISVIITLLNSEIIAACSFWLYYWRINGTSNISLNRPGHWADNCKMVYLVRIMQSILYVLDSILRLHNVVISTQLPGFISFLFEYLNFQPRWQFP